MIGLIMFIVIIGLSFWVKDLIEEIQSMLKDYSELHGKYMNIIDDNRTLLGKIKAEVKENILWREKALQADENALIMAKDSISACKAAREIMVSIGVTSNHDYFELMLKKSEEVEDYEEAARYRDMLVTHPKVEVFKDLK